MRNQSLLGIAGLLGLAGCADSLAEFQTCIDSADLADHVEVSYDRFMDSTHAATRLGRGVALDVVHFMIPVMLAPEVRALIPPHEPTPPTLRASVSCAGSGPCRPHSIELAAFHVSREAIWQGEGDMIFLHSNGDRMRVAVKDEQLAREAFQGGVEESVGFNVAYRDFLRIACDDHTEFSFHGLEGAVDHAGFRALARVLERGDRPVAVDPPPELQIAALDPEPAAPPLTIPDWYQLDPNARTVALTIEAGSNSSNNYWNYNGHYGGRGEVFIPQGYTVTVRFRNSDPNMAHSIGVVGRRSSYPATFSNPAPAFSGGITSNPTSMTRATMPGEEETITFVAAEAGAYDFICYVAGHAVVGMTLPIVVSEDGQAGFRE